MNRILTCPHCGPTLTEARLRCDRCGRELVYISEAEFTNRQLAAEADASTPSRTRRAGLWIGVSAAAAVVVAMAGLTVPGRLSPASPPPDSSMQMAPQPPAALSAPAAAVGRTAASPPSHAPVEAVEPGNLAAALERYRAALAEKPADAELLANVGQILVAMDRPADAVPFLEQAVEAEPFSVVARFDLAVAYGRSGLLKEAVEQYESLVQSGDADMRVHHNLGLALRQLGRNGEAAAAFERATAMEPAGAPAWLGLALSLEADGRRSEAATALERYLALEPAAADADNVRARIVRLRGTAEPAAPGADAGSEPAGRRP
ncbi:MAG: tetratricopeptide repeat protein [Vicinamibacterales bacterium]